MKSFVQRYGTLSMTCALLLSLLSYAGAQSGKVSIKNFGEVNHNYYRGSQPTQKTVRELKDLGIKTVIDLRKDRVEEEETWVSSEGMKYINIPLKASRPATEAEWTEFLSLVNDPENWPVYVHCKGGRHRTGAMTALYRMTHDGWTAERAWQEMKDFDFNSGLFGGPGAQKKFVFTYFKTLQADDHALPAAGK